MKQYLIDTSVLASGLLNRPDLRTAEALGHAIPAHVLAQATEVVR